AAAPYNYQAQPATGQQQPTGFDWGQAAAPGLEQPTFGGQQFETQPGYRYQAGPQATQSFPQQSFPQQPYGQGGYPDPYAQAQAGQQQFGYETQQWQAPAPAHSGRKGLWIGLVSAFVVVAGVIVAVLFVTGVLYKKVFDQNALNTDIANQYNSHFLEKVTVNCPKGQRVKKDTTFTCSLSG